MAGLIHMGAVATDGLAALTALDLESTLLTTWGRILAILSR